MPVIEAQCASILVPHDHRHINQNRILVCGFPRSIGGEQTNPSTWIDGCGTACRNTESAQCLPFTGTDWGVWVQAVGEGGVAAAGALGADGGGQGAAGSG
jgi:hypothetical protein